MNAYIGGVVTTELQKCFSDLRIQFDEDRKYIPGRGDSMSKVTVKGGRRMRK